MRLRMKKWIRVCALTELFCREKKRLRAVRNQLGEYFQKNKFVISSNKTDFDRDETESKTNVDRFVAILADSNDGGQRLGRYLLEQSFDTEAINYDVERYPSAQNSNIFGLVINDEDARKKMDHFINRRRRTFLSL